MYKSDDVDVQLTFREDSLAWNHLAMGTRGGTRGDGSWCAAW